MRKVLIGGFLAVVAALALLAQTRVRVGMISGPAGAARLLVVTPNGAVAVASVGPGVALVETAGGFVLQSTVAPRYWGEKAARQPDGSYTIQHPATNLAIFRNGLRQHAGDDYTYDATARKIVPVAAYPWSDDDLITVDYE